MVLQPVLGSATNAELLHRLFSVHAVNLVFHAAAYKHVPLVEVNPLAGLANNVDSTHQLCRAAVANGVAQVVLISTDKAVRPTNVMGASKRLAELVVQAHAAEGYFHLFVYGSLWQCSGFIRIGCTPVSSPDRCWWSDHSHSPGYHPLFHDYP